MIFLTKWKLTREIRSSSAQGFAIGGQPDEGAQVYIKPDGDAGKPFVLGLFITNSFLVSTKRCSCRASCRYTATGRRWVMKPVRSTSTLD